MNIEHLSYSGMTTYKKCGKLYELKYKHGIREEPTDKMLAGGIFHEAMHLAWLGHDVDGDMIQRLCRERGINSRHIVAQIENAIHLAYREVIWNEDYKPTETPSFGCEMEIEADLGGGVNFFGIADLVTSSGIVYDYKFTTSTSPHYDVRKSVQLALYSHALGLDKIGYLVFIGHTDPTKTKLIRNNIECGPITVPPQLFTFAVESVKETYQMIQMDLFMRTNTFNHWCGKGCPGYSVCFGVDEAKEGS